MIHPYFASAEVHYRYQKLLDEAENYRQVKALRKGKSKVRIPTKIQQIFTSQPALDTSRPVDTPA